MGVINFFNFDFSFQSEIIIAVLLFIFTFILEDAATSMAALLAADGRISIILALIVLFLGILCGDIGIYGLGYLASKWKALQNWIYGKVSLKTRHWFENKLFIIIFTTGFLPGMRLPTYLSCGFFQLNFKTYILAVTMGSFLRSMILFFIVYFLGEQVFHKLGFWKWPVSLIFLLVVIIILPRVFYKKREKKSLSV